MSSNVQFQKDALFQRCREERCTPKERAYIAESADLLARVAAMRRDDAALQQLFSYAERYRPIHDDRPSPDDLIAYVDGTLIKARRQFVNQHAQRDPQIREEIRVLRQLGCNLLTSE